MIEQIQIPTDASRAQVELIVGALRHSLAFAVDHIALVEGADSAETFRNELVSGLKNGDLDISIFDDAATFDYVTSIVESVGTARV